MRLPIRIRVKKRWKIAGVVLLCAVAVSYLLWQTSGFVNAFRQVKRAHIFPTSVSATGWQNSENALFQDLSPQAPYASFSQGNSAYLSVASSAPQTEGNAGGGGSLETSPVQPPTSDPGNPPPADPSPAVTPPAEQPATPPTPQEQNVPSAPAAGGNDAAPPAESVPDPSPAPQTETPSPVQETPPPSTLRTSPQPLASRLGSYASFLLAQTATVVFATTSDTPSHTTSSTPVSASEEGEESNTAESNSSASVAACTVLGIECRLIEFKDFVVGGSIEDKEFKKAELKFSLASLAAEGGALDGKLTVHYFHNGHWRSAGEIFLNQEISNATQGSYFSQVLDDVTSWQDMADVKVVFEYEPGEGNGPVMLYLDAVWLDAVYMDPVQDVLDGSTEDPGDAPQNVSFSLIPGERDSVLILENGEKISFPYLNSLKSDRLAMRADKVSYVSENSGTPTDVYASITNTGKSADSFTLFASFPGSVGQVSDVAQYLRNVPSAATTTEVSDLTYFCESGWQASSSTPQHSCATTGEVYVCSSIDSEGTNCLVPGVTVATTTSTSYTSAWVPMAILPAHDDRRVEQNLPSGYQVAFASAKKFDILPGQTVYFKLTVSTPDTGKVRFVLSAKGDNSFGSLDSMKLRDETYLLAQAKLKKVKTDRKHLNDQLSEKSDFNVDELPQFHFKFKTQRGFFTQVKDTILRRQVPYSVESAKLRHETGEIEHLLVDIEYTTGDEWTLKLKKEQRAFRPGKYSLDLAMSEGASRYTDTVPFYWGVLALNPDKSSYEPESTAHLQLAALDNAGNTMCDAQLILTATDPDGNTTEIPIVSGGGCGDNNITDLPDFVADYRVGGEGEYTLELSRLNDAGDIVTGITEKLIVKQGAPYVVTRTGPTRIYPQSAYSMRMRIEAPGGFTGAVTETLPEGFTVANTGGAIISRDPGIIRLTWNVALMGGETKDIAYTFKAPEVSPYMYLLGPLALSDTTGAVYTEPRTWKIASDATSIATGVAWLTGSSTTNGTSLSSTTPYALTWNLSSDYDSTYFTHSTTSSNSQLTVNVDGDYLIALTVPQERADTAGTRTTVEADIRVNGGKKNIGVSRAFIRTNSNVNESSNHLHVLLKDLEAGDYVEAYVHNVTTATDFVTIASQASLYAEYIGNDQSVYFGLATTTNLATSTLNSAATSSIAWYDDPTLGRSDSNYTHNNSSASTTITLAAAGDYMVFVNIPYTSITANVNVFGRVLIDGTLVSGGEMRQGYTDTNAGSIDASLHWSGVVHATTTNQRLSIAVLQGGAAATSINVNADTASIYIQKLPSTEVYFGTATSTTVGGNWNQASAQSIKWTSDTVKDTGTYTHSTTSSAHQVTVSKAGDYLLTLNDSLTGAVTRTNSVTSISVNGSARSGAQTKTHFIRNQGGHNESSGSLVYLLRDLAINDVITVTTVAEATAGTTTADFPAHLMLWHKQAQSSFIQQSEMWYANVNGEPPTDPWPTGAVNLNEGDAITTGNSVKSGDVLRLRMALTANATTIAGADSFKLQYAAGSECSLALAWTDVGAVGSGEIWRGYDNAAVSAGATLSTTVLTYASTTQTYEEQNPSAATPNGVPVGSGAEWDWVIENNTAPVGTSYCFRMVHSSGQLLKDYLDYPLLVTNNTPEVPTLVTMFDNEKTASTSPQFSFVSSDENGEDLHYQIQVSTDPAFGSTVIDEDSVTYFDKFVDQVNNADKAPFATDETIKYFSTATLTSGTTYWWRVRSKDLSGTNTWSAYSSAWSFTVDTALATGTTWFQTTSDQFNTGTLSQVAATSTDDVRLSSGFLSGTIYSPAISYAGVTVGNSWGSVSWTNTQTGGTILYRVEYYTSTSSWAVIPDSEISGNTAGTTTSPIVLTQLDPSTYSTIRIRAAFTQVSASPRLSDWTVTWALSVAQPTLLTPFDSEKVATTTPTFTFTTSDPQSNDLVYQIQWATTSAFTTSTTTRTSDTHAGFSDVSSTTDLTPFASGDTISFTVQPADRLASSTTWWWRVRAKDPAGGDAYSLWSDPKSITTDTTVNRSTWFQTTSDQFTTDTLTLTGSANGSTTATSTTGNIGVYRHAVAGETITTATFDNGWDTTVRQDSIYSLTGTTTLNLARSGHYAVMYGLVFNGIGGSTNRSEIQTGINLAGTFIPAGWSQGFIRRTVGAFEGFSSGGAIINVAADNDTLKLQSFRTDSNTAAGVRRMANTSGLQVIKLDDSWSYTRLSKTAKQAGPVSTSWIPVTYDREDELDTTDFGHSSGGSGVTLKNAGHYLVFANTYGSLRTNNSSMIVQKLKLDNTDIEGSFTTVFTNGNANADGDYQGAASIGMIVQSTSSNQVLTVQLARSSGTAAWTINGDRTGAYVDRTGLTIVKLPEADFIQLTNSTSTRMMPTAQTPLLWNTEVEEDASFSHSTTSNLARVIANTAGDYLLLGSLYAAPGTTAAVEFGQTWRKNGGTQLQYGQTGGFNNTATTNFGNFSSIIFPSVIPTDYFEMLSVAMGSTTSTVGATKKGLQGVRIASLSEADTNPKTVVSSDIVFTSGAGPKWSTFSWYDNQTASATIVYQLLYLSATSTYSLVPDSALPGNSVGYSTTTSVDISGLSRTTYGTLRTKATFTCFAGFCPSLGDWTVTWSQGINISGTAKQFDQVTNVNSGDTVRVAVNGVLSSKTGTISGGTWSIANVTAFQNDIITVFVSTTSVASRAVAVTEYTGTNDITGMSLNEMHLTLGSDDNPTLSNVDLSQYDNSVSGNAELFNDVSGGNLTVCAVTQCDSARLLIKSGTIYQPGGNITMPNFQNDGVFTPEANTVTVSHSWRNDSIFNKGTSSVIFTATSTNETVNSTTASTSGAFYAVTFGQTSGTAQWTLMSPIAASSTFAINYGTVLNGTTTLTLSGNLSIGANGVFSRSTGSTTFSGTGTNTWTDSTASKQDMGDVFIAGNSKTVQLGSDVRATNIVINTGNTLDASGSGYGMTVLSNWTNSGTFSAQTGTVTFAATTTGRTISPGASSFYNLTFNGVAGNWAFSGATTTATNNFTVATGTVTLPTATTTVGGSFDASTGSFIHNNATVLFTASSAKTINPGASSFFELVFNGSGSWSFTGTNATSSRNTIITAGTVTLPSATLAIGGSFLNTGGAFTHNSGTVKMTATATGKSVQANGSNFSNLIFNGAGGGWTFVGANATTSNTFTIATGTVTLPSGTLAVGGSFLNTGGLFTHNSGTVRFTAASTGFSITPATSTFYNVIVDSTSGGWTITDNATSTNNFTLQNAASFAVASSTRLEVGGTFTNAVGGSATAFGSSTLALTSGTSYSLNTKNANGDYYGVLSLAASTNIRMWNSSSASTSLASTGSLYSQNHASSSGSLYVYGAFSSSGSEYWSYATDFDGATLAGAARRQVQVRIASSSSLSFTAGSLGILGTSSATTTVANQGIGTYSLSVSGGTLAAQYFQIASTSSAGFSISGTPTVSTFANGEFTLSLPSGGTSLTVASTVIDQNPALQIQQMRFATSTGVNTGFNVVETGSPSSYWWFRNHYGNFAGEANDSDPGPNSGNPGYIRWDDSGYSLTISGHVYADHGVTPIGDPPCDNLTPVVTIVVGVSTYTGVCNGSGLYIISGVQFTGDTPMTVFLNTNGGKKAVTVTKTPTADISDLDLYENALIVRHEGASAATIADLAVYTESNDSDVFFAAATTTPPSTLTLRPERELYIWTGKTFAPGGNVTLQSGGSGSVFDGRLFIATSSTFTAAGTESHAIGGGFLAQSGSTFTAANSTVTFAATTTGKSIYSSQALTFYNLTLNGSGGQWSVVSTTSPTTISNTFTLTAGTLAGTGSVTVQSGNVTGNGIIAMTGGTFLISGTGSLGSSNAWQFANLTLGDGTSNATTKTGSGTTTITGVLTVATSQTLNAGSSPWVLSGGGTPFVISGTFTPQSAPFTYSASSATAVTNASYAGLTLAPAAAGSPTYTLAGGTPTFGYLTLGDGTNPVTVTANTNDPSIAVSGAMQINQNATYIASNVGALNVGRSWLNAGTFTHSNGSVLFNATTTGNVVQASTSPFYDVTFNSSSGGWTITGNATSTHDFSLSSASSFAVASSTRLEVGGTFTNAVGGSATALGSSTLALTSGTSYSINTKSAGGDYYGILSLAASTNIRMWNSSSASTSLASTGSLYSQNHAAVNGSLYIYGAYTRSSGSDYWSYATDFDGVALGGSSRQVAVQIASSSSVTVSGGLLDMVGGATATTTVANQGAGAYSLSVTGGTLNAQYYQIRNTGIDGLSLSGSPTISSLSNGDYLLAASSTMITVAGSVIDANPLKIIRAVQFATSSGVAGGFNAKATGTSASSWKFNLHYGNYSGEAYDSDPAGDPGYLRWDDSAAQISISGNVYSDEGITVSPACDDLTSNVKLVVEGSTSYTTTCSSSDGSYIITGISFNPGDTLTLFLDTNGGRRAANVSVDPISTISGMDLYENRVILRHEDTAPITIAQIDQYDSVSDTDIPFTSTLAATNTLVLPPNTELIIWDSKTFAPAGNVTIQSGTNANSYDGSLEVRTGATFSAAGTQIHSLGGSLIFGSGSSLVSANSTFTFTATTTGKTITPPASSTFYNMTFAGAGGNWAFSSNATTTGSVSVATGTVTLPTGVLTVGGSFTKNPSGTFIHNNGTLVLNATASGNNVQLGTSSLYMLTFNGSGGAWTFLDTNATTSNTLTISAGTVTLPSGTLAVGSSFLNTGGAFTHNSGTVKMTATASGKSIQAGGSNFSGLTFSGVDGGWSFLDASATTTSTFTIATGTVVLPSGTLEVGGSFLNLGGLFTHNNGTVRFTAVSTGFFVTPATSTFYNVIFNSSSGGWTITGNATSTHDFSLSSASSFAVASSTRLEVGGTFTNAVGGSATALGSSTLALTSGTSYSINTKSAGGDYYGILSLAASTNIRMWNSSSASTSLASTGSLYSQNHAAVNGSLYIYGAYTRSSGSDYWSYATDFDGVALGGSSRQVAVQIASSSSVTVSGGLLDMVGGATATTTVANQGAGAYSLSVTGGTLNAQYYQIRNTGIDGLSLSGSPTISSLSNGDYLLAASSTMITLAAATLDANASLHFYYMKFATSSGVTGGFNIKVVGTTANAWTISGSYGNYDGEAYDGDGTDACSNIRWDDSSCLFANQAHYRWRNDDGGEGALASEWYNVSWDYRKKIVVNNPNASSYTNLPVKFSVLYDSSMNSDFSDLRFTDSTGTASIPYFIESSDASASSTVWVKVPSLPASGSATIYMYYGNVAATDASDGDNTFDFYESFESNSLASYSGDTATKFQTGTSFARHGTYGLDAGSHSAEKTVTGIYRTGSQTAQGKTIRFFQYVDASQQDEPCTLFGVQSAGNNYAICLDEYPSQAVEIVRNVTSNDTSGAPAPVTLATSSASYTTGWYEVSIDWLTSNTINASVYNSAGTAIATLSTTTSTYTSGGMGFSFWGQHGGWDYYTVRQYTASAPTVIFGARQGNNGATWAAAEDAALSALGIGSNIRLRFSIQNTGADLTNNYRLQVAPKGVALNCESVSPGSYNDVPTTALGCGSGVACMTSSAQFTNLSSTSPSLSYPASIRFAQGEIVEDPSNQTISMTIPSNYATEVEYNFQMTSNATGNAYCFRSSKAGIDFDSYDHVAQATILHAPTLGIISFNSSQDIPLTEGASTTILATTTVTDLNGYADLISATSTMFRSGVFSSCTANDNSCYQIASTSCAFSSCAGNSCTLTCSTNMQFFADPTDSGSAYFGEHWYARMSVIDASSLYSIATSSYQDVLTLYGLDLNTSSINFSTLDPGSNSTSTATTTIINTGNSPIDIRLSGSDLSGPAGPSYDIPVNSQKYATSTFVYGSCSICQLLTGSATNVSVNIIKTTSSTTQSTKNLFWGINVPTGRPSGAYSGSNTFTAVTPGG